jgi:hypothetical protein
VVVNNANLQQVARRDPEPVSNLCGNDDLAFGKCSNGLHGVIQRWFR